MTVEEIQTALGELVAAMVEKGVPTPKVDCTIRPPGEKMYLYLSAEYRRKVFDGTNSKFCYCTTVAGAFKQARAYIAALPSPEEAVTREYLGKVADAIDYATKHSIDDDYVTPLRGVTCAMTDNLLTKESAE